MEDLAAALRNVGASSGGPSQCLTLAVTGATGGVGSSSVAANLAAILAEDPSQSVVLVDLDLTLGDMDVLLDVVQGQTLLEVLQNVERLDVGLLRRSLTKLESGLFVLPRPDRVGEAGGIQPESLNRLLVQLKASFSHIVLDLSKGYTALDVVALEHCDLAVLVTQLTLPSLRNVVRLQQAFGDIEDLDQRVRIVVNRCCVQSPVRLKKAEEIMGREIFWQLPNDYPLMVEACNQGLPLIASAPRAELTQSLRAMAAGLVASPVTGGAASAARTASGPGRWLRFWSPAARTAALGG
jgi:pilus assembly protein CpaE